MNDKQNGDNLKIWSAVETTDYESTKGFSRPGGFSGTAVNPTWLVKKATEIFGPVGDGWGYEIIDEKYVDGHYIDQVNRLVVHIICLRFWYTQDNNTHSFVHFGQTTFVGVNTRGVFTDEEAPKKSLTDALGKCLSMLGFSADVYMGKWDDNKYVNDRQNDFENTRNQTPEQKSLPKLKPGQVKKVEGLIAETKTSIDAFLIHYGAAGIEVLTKDQYDDAIKNLTNKKIEMTSGQQGGGANANT